MDYQKQDELFKKYKESSSKEEKILIRNQICSMNYGLVGLLTKNYKTHNKVEFNDLFNEGVIGLMRAVEKYDPSMGYKFSTFARDWILSGIRLYIKKKIPAIYTGANISNEMKKLLSSSISLDKKHREGSTPFIEVPYEDNMNCAEERSTNDFLAKVIEESLNEDDAYIIECFYGINTPKKTLVDIGKDLGLTKQRIAQKRVKAETIIREFLSPTFFNLRVA